MFNRFELNFLRDAQLGGPAFITPIEFPHEKLISTFFFKYGGGSFNQGQYRVMNANTCLLGNTFIANAFPTFANHTFSFAYDWLGRIFALDSSRRHDASPAVLMFEPGTGEALEIPCNLLTFHENELIQESEAALAVSFHKRWLATGGAIPNCTQCVGYKKPLFLGGIDAIENLEVADLEVYWSMSEQLIVKTRNLPRGTRIGKIGLSD